MNEDLKVEEERNAVSGGRTVPLDGKEV